MCLAFVRTRYGLPKRESTAIGAWRDARHKHRHDRNPPPGVPIFWYGGSHRAGHVAISLGRGMIISTDFPHTGHIARVRLSAVRRHWGLRYLGWTEDLEGRRIYRR
jgi:cell wall-associated NlpC family hydrolase